MRCTNGIVHRAVAPDERRHAELERLRRETATALHGGATCADAQGAVHQFHESLGHTLAA